MTSEIKFLSNITPSSFSSELSLTIASPILIVMTTSSSVRSILLWLHYSFTSILLTIISCVLKSCTPVIYDFLQGCLSICKIYNIQSILLRIPLYLRFCVRANLKYFFIRYHDVVRFVYLVSRYGLSIY